ncbi:MAG: zinc-binding dehydrogenase [FCB group bacterium]|nr:zinc-binding dehydrogenase [FCB group bacterium]
MKAVRIHTHGGPEVLQWEEIPDPKPGDSQVLVRIKATSLNHLDIWIRNGVPGTPLPIILGSDGAGVVEEVGKGVTSFKPGDEVIIQPLTYCGHCRFCETGRENYCKSFGIYGENQNGTHCELMVVEEKNLRLKPDFLLFEEAASFALVGQTAYAMLVRRAQIEPGESVLVWGAGSGVGSMAVQIAKTRHCFVIATGGSEEKLRLAKELGADIVIDHYRQEVLTIVKEVTAGNGVDVVFEHVGAATWETSLKALGRGGRLVTCGATTGAKVNLDLRHLFFKQQSVLGSTMGDVAAFEAAFALLKERKIKPVVDRIFPMKDVQKAHQYLENRRQLGKVVLVP